jgi:hypothetical protein
MAYTPSPYRIKTEVSFNGLIMDGNRNALTGALGNGFQSRDATATPVNSPLAMTGSVQTITVPEGAFEFNVNPKTAVVQVSEDSTMTAYFTVPIDVSQTFPCARQKYIYLKGTSSDKVDFYFNMLNAS